MPILDAIRHVMVQRLGCPANTATYGIEAIKAFRPICHDLYGLSNAGN